MTRFLVTAAALGLAAAAIAQTASPPASSAAADGMSFEAWAAGARARLMALDTDHDGRISKDEMAAGGGMMGRRAAANPSAGGDAPRRDPARMFERMDTNNDGYLDAAEINAMLARRFARMDANHDGVLTADERGAMRGMNAPEQ
jgi:Ca2+-binding EF-hand superfamily protein